MKQSEEFEWCEFNNLADSYINQSNEENKELVSVDIITVLSVQHVIF